VRAWRPACPCTVTAPGIANDGRILGWAHALRERGHHVASIGKLHFWGHPEDDYGFTESLLAMHITGSVGDVTHLVRGP
jgi:choline-sulfatase